MSREQEIRQRLEKTTDGPWMVNAGGHHPMREVGAPFGEAGTQSIALCRAISIGGRGGGKKDAEFIAMAKEDIPYLLSIIDEQRAALEAVDRFFQAPQIDDELYADACRKVGAALDRGVGE